MSNMRKRFEAGFKARVALEALKGGKTMAELSSEYGVHASQISKWKQDLQKGVVQVFSCKKDASLLNQEDLVEKLYRNVGELKLPVQIRYGLRILHIFGYRRGLHI